MEKLLVAQVERLFVVEARIEPYIFRSVSPTVYQLSYPDRYLKKKEEKKRKMHRTAESTNPMLSCLCRAPASTVARAGSGQ
jgi:hypothetical protein